MGGTIKVDVLLKIIVHIKENQWYQLEDSTDLLH